MAEKMKEDITYAAYPLIGRNIAKSLIANGPWDLLQRNHIILSTPKTCDIIIPQEVFLSIS